MGSGCTAVSLPLWHEALVGIEMVYLRLSPVYWGAGIKKGDGSAVVVIPPLLATDLYLAEFRNWLKRIGYTPYSSGIGFNADCPNMLIRQHLAGTVEKAFKQSHGRRVHLIGHSLGGLIARAAAAQMPDRVASVTTMGSPLRSLRVHPALERLVDVVRSRILKRHGMGVEEDGGVLPACYTPACSCAFLRSLVLTVPETVHQTAIYSKADGFVDWRVCVTGDQSIDVEVSATHLGMAWNPMVYKAIAERLAEAKEVRHAVRSRSSRRGRHAA